VSAEIECRSECLLFNVGSLHGRLKSPINWVVSSSLSIIIIIIFSSLRQQAPAAASGRSATLELTSLGGDLQLERSKRRRRGWSRSRSPPLLLTAGDNSDAAWQSLSEKFGATSPVTSVTCQQICDTSDGVQITAPSILTETVGLTEIWIPTSYAQCHCINPHSSLTL